MKRGLKAWPERDMDFPLSEWLNLLVRWFHIFAGILWIGSTWYFVWLDKALHAVPGQGVTMVHSGGFYSVGKLKDPKVDPSQIHWFRFETLFTWLSGLCLLGIVYYWGGLLVDGALPEGQAMAAGVASLVVAWFVYDTIWILPLPSAAAAALCYALLVGAAYFLCWALGGRAAFIHLGAMMGTCMTLNVWRRILPNQKKLVAQLAAGQTPDAALAAQAKARSTHNTFMILPVVMTMISNHYPTATYGSDKNWLVFAVLMLLGMGAAKLVKASL